MSNLTPDEVNNRLDETRNELQLEDQRLWQGLADEKVSRIAGDKANKDLIDNTNAALSAQESRLSVEVVQREEGDLRNITSVTELAQALSDFRIKSELELNNERIARQQLGVDLENKIVDYTVHFDHKFYEVYQTIQTYQDETNGKLTLFDERIKKYEDMLQDITTDSIQITMDNGEINMGAWTILSQAREWDLEILGKFKDYQIQTNKDIDEALKDIQDKLPVEQDIIDKAIEALSEAPIIKDLDSKITGAIDDIDELHKDILQETVDRQNELIDMAQKTADELAKNQADLVSRVEAESQERIDALKRESEIRQQELLNEAAERSAEIDERIKDIEGGVTTDLTEAYRRIDEVNEKADNYKADADQKIAELNTKADGIHDEIGAETEARIEAIKKLNDGLSQEIAYRKAGDEASMEAINNYKTSNDKALANVRDELALNVTATTANAEAIRSLDTRLTVAQGDATEAKNLAASATQKAETALSETSALASQMTTVNASIEGIQNDLANKADAAAFNQLKAEVTDLDGKVTTNTSDLTALKTTVNNIDGTVKGQTSAISELQSHQTIQDGKISQLTTDTTALKNTLEDVQEEMSTKVETTAFNELKTAVEKNGNDLSLISSDVTTLKTDMSKVQKDVSTKAEASAVQALETKITDVDGKVSVNTTAITQMDGRIETVEDGLKTKLDASVIDAYSTTVETNKAIAERISEYNAQLVIGGDNLVTNHNDIVVVSNNATQYPIQTRVEEGIRGFKSLAPSALVSTYSTTYVNLEIGKTYVSSFKMRTTSGTTYPVRLYPSSTQVDLVEAPTISLPADGSWVVVYAVYKAKATRMRIPVFFSSVPAPEWVEYKEAMIQEGTKYSGFVESTNGMKNDILANASAITQTNSKVTNIDGRVTSNSNSIVGLRNDVTKNTQDISTKASSQAVTDLKSQVDVMDGKVTSNSQAVTKLNNDVAQIQGDMKNMATSSAVQALDSRVTTAEGKLTTQQSAITKLQGDLESTNTAVSKKADASALTALDNKVTVINGKVESQSTQLTELSNNLSVSDRLTRLQSQGKPLIDDPTFDKRAVLGNYQHNTNVTGGTRAVTAGNPSNGLREYYMTAVGALPASGCGWYPLNPNLWAKANKIFLIKQVLKAPVGYTMNIAKNATGDNSIYEILGNNQGTGKFETYYFWLQCGSVGSFSTFGHVRWTRNGTTALPTPAAPAEFVVSSYEAWDVTAVDDSIPAAWEEKITANATATDQLNSKVTDIDGVVTSHSTQITNLTNRVTKTEKDIETKADSSALQTLDSKVTTIGNKTDANAADITTLKGNITTINGALETKADATAVTNLTNRVTQNEKDIKSSSDAITSLNNTITSGATGTSLNSVAGFNKGAANISPGEDALVPSSDAYGGKVIKLGNNSGNDTVWGEGKSYVPIDPNRMYRVKAKYRRVTGTGVVYIGIVCKDDLDRYINVSGAVSATISGSSYLIQHRPNLGEWQTGEWFVTGRGSSASGAGTLAEPRKFQPNATKFAPMFIANYNATAGEVEIDFITIEYADEYPLIDANAKATQTLSSKVETVEGKVTTLTSSVTSLEGRVNTVEGNLQQKADVSALNALDARVVQNGKDIEANSAAVTKVDTRIDNLSVGTANLQDNSHFDKPNIFNGYAAVYGTQAVANSQYTKTTTSVTSSNRIQKLMRGLAVGTTYTLTLYAKTSKLFDFRNFVGASVVRTILPEAASTDKFQKYSVVFTTREANVTMYGYTANVPVGDVVTIEWEKLEEGNVPSDWSPSKGDIDANFNAQSTAIQTLESRTSTVEGKVTTNTEAITTLKGQVNTIQGDLEKKVDASVLNGYYTKVETDSAIAGGITQYNSNLRIGAANQAFNTQDGRLWSTGYLGAKIERTTELSRDLLKSAVNQPFRLVITGGTNALKTTPLVSVAKAAECVLSFKVKNEGTEPFRFNFNGFNHPVTNAAGGAIYLKGKRDVLAGEELEIVVHGRMRPDFDWFQFQIQVPNLQYESISLIMTDVMVNEGNAQAAWSPPYQNVNNDIAANANAINNTETKVSNLEGVVAGQATQINNLTATVAGKADASAVTSLEARVKTSEGKIESLTTSTTNLTNRVQAAEGNITANTNNISTMNNKITEVDGRVTSQATQINKVEATLSGQVVGGTNLLQGTQKFENFVAANVGATLTKVAGGFKTDLIRVTKNAATASGAYPIPANRKLVARAGTPMVVSFKARGNIEPRYLYLMSAGGTGNGNIAANTVSFSGTFNATTFITVTAVWDGTGFSYSNNAYPYIGNTGGAAGTWFEFAELMVQEGNKGTVWSPSYLDIPEVDLSDYAKASAVTALDTKVSTIDGKVTAQANQITQLQSDVGANSAKLNITAEVVDGLKAGYYVKTDVDGLVAGFGLYNDGDSSAFGVNADYFYIGKESGGKKPFIVTTTPQTIDGVSYPAGTWIHTALIANATIGTAHIANASITNAKISELDASKITTGTLDAARIKVGAATQYEVGYDPITKARTFIAQPTTPYRVGDIWKNGNTTSICITSRASGAYVAADWGKTGDVTSENTAANSNQLGGTPAATINTNITNATNTANTAKNTADSANNQVNAWKFTGTTEIDGGKIRADTVTAVQMNVAELSAISGNLGTLETVDPSGAKTVMTGALTTVYYANGNVAVRMGIW